MGDCIMFTNDKVISNNQVDVVGRIISGFRFWTNQDGKDYYTSLILIERTSGYEDIIKFVCSSDQLIDDVVGKTVHIIGEFRSYNYKDTERKSHVFLYIYTNTLDLLVEDINHTNNIRIKGYVCKLPILRNTPLGKVICDLTVAVNRSFGKSDYLPCIAWGSNAVTLSELSIGDEINFVGRIQGREYIKNNETKIAYEVSINKIL